MYNAVAYAIDQCPKTDGCSGTHHTACLQRKIGSYFDKEDDVDFTNTAEQSRLAKAFCHIGFFLYTLCHATSK